MKSTASNLAILSLIAITFSFVGCRSSVVAEQEPTHVAEPSVQPETPKAFQPSPAVPNLQAEITDDRFKTTSSDIGKFDFRNFTYPLPRAWQHPDGKEITLENGKVKPVTVDIEEEMSNEEKA